MHTTDNGTGAANAGAGASDHAGAWIGPDNKCSATVSKYAKIVGLWLVLRPNARWLRNRRKWLVEVEGVERKFEVTRSRLLSPRKFVLECLSQTDHQFVPMPDADWHLHVAQAVAASGKLGPDTSRDEP